MGTLSVGRVQTVILWLIVTRYIANRTHAAAFYYTHAADIVIGSRSLAGRYVSVEGAPVDDKGRLNDEAFAQEVARASPKRGGGGPVTGDRRKDDTGTIAIFSPRSAGGGQ